LEVFKSRAVLQINLNNINHNINLLRSRSPSSKLLVMLKADGYGHGAESIIPLLKSTDGVAVARFNEAIKLRECFPNLTIVLLSGFLDENELKLISKYRIDTAIFQQEQLDLLHTSQLINPINVWVKIDVGMRRLGFENEIGDVVIELESNNNVENIRLMGHLSSADELDNEITLKQIQQFNHITRGLKYETSLANSSGILYWPESHKTWNRPGLALYGVKPISTTDIDLKPAMLFQGVIIAFKYIKKGQRLGYALAYTAEENSLIAIVSVGYADGLPRCSSNKNRVWIKGEYSPLIGRISMDSSFVDVSGRKDLVLGDKVEFWGEHIPVEEVAKNNNTIPYELLVGLSSRVQLEIVN
jgi:alanine racemase